jgi:hypothetical protein
MNLNLYDRNLKRIAVIESRYVSCMSSEGYNSTQPFTMELQASDEYKQKVQPDCYVGRDDRKTMMVIKTVKVKDGRIVASGKQAQRCLDDVAFEGSIPAGRLLGDSIKGAYDSSHGYENFEIAPSDLPITYDHQISNKSILLLLETMCQDTDTGFRVVRANGKLRTELYRPELNIKLKLAQKYGNMRVDEVTLSTENEKNYAIVLGEGEGDARFRVYVDLSSGEQKRSMFVDARDVLREEGETDVSYSARLYARGVEQLLTKQGTWECALTPLGAEFGSRYDLGDIVTVLLPDYGMKIQSRIQRFTQQSQNNKIDTIVEVGNITITR